MDYGYISNEIFIHKLNKLKIHNHYAYEKIYKNVY